jgi:hypothetical protein
MPELTFDVFRREFGRKVIDNKITWEAIGFYAPDGRIYPFGTDTKVISTVFESLLGPLVKDIADQFDYIVEGSEQTVYPDFTLSQRSRQTKRIALDVKTTYRKFNNNGQMQQFRYTLGSYTSFLRTPGATKNIKYPYIQYSDHWIIGFLYTRREGIEAKVYYHPKEITHLHCPYQDVEFFVQEKYRIVGLTPASGNTTNIGSFPTNNLDDLRQGRGPFAALGKAVCDEYWRNYEKNSQKRQYSSIEQFFLWKKTNAG